MKRFIAIIILAAVTGYMLGAMVAMYPQGSPATPEPGIDDHFADVNKMVPVAPMVHIEAATEPTEPAPVTTLPTAPEYSQADAELIARLLWSECRGEPYDGQLMVAQCVLDRLADGRWGDTVESVIYSPTQFAAPGELTQELLDVAVAALCGERFSEDRILFFRVTSSTADWHAPYLGRVGAHGYYGEGDNEN